MRILLFELQPIVRLGLHHLFSSFPTPCHVIEVAREDFCSPAFLETPDTPWNDLYGPIDLIMVDPMGCREISCPAHRQDHDVLQAVIRRADTVPVVVFSASESPAEIRHALASGAVAYIPKATDVSLLSSILQLVHAGGVYVPPCLADRFHELVDPSSPTPTGQETMDVPDTTLGSMGLNHTGSPTDLSAAPPTGLPASDRGPTDRAPPTLLQTAQRRSLPAPLNQLTRRQFQVLQLLSLGLSNADIGQRLDLNLSTVKSHVTGILKTLAVSSRTQAVLLFNQYRERRTPSSSAQQI